MDGATPYPQADICSIKVTQVIDPVNFSAQIGTADILEYFVKYQEALDQICEQMPRTPADLANLEIGQLVLAKSQETDHWQRARIATISSETNEVDVLYIDYGTNEFISLDHVVTSVPENLAELAPLSCRSCLVGVKPIANTWIGRAVTRFCYLVEDKILDAQLLHIFENGVHLVDILVEDKGSVKSVSEILIEEELAMENEELVPYENANASQFGPFDNFSANTNTEDMTNGESVMKVPEFDKGKLNEKAISKLGKEEEIYYHRLIRPLFRQESTGWGCSDTNIGSTNRPHTGVDSIKHIQEQVRKIYRSASNQKTDENEQTVFDTQDKELKEVHQSQANEKLNIKEEKLEDTKSQKAAEVGKESSAEVGAGDRETRRSSGRMGRGRGSRTSTPEQRSKPDKEVTPKRPSRNDEAAKPGINSEEGPNRDKRRRPAGGSTTHREKLQNEYEWHSQQLIFKFDKIFKRMTPENADELLTELKPLVYPAKSTLEGLPGPKELHLLLHTALEKAIESMDHQFDESAIKVVQFMRRHKEFADVISTVLWKLQHTYVKSASGTHSRQQCDLYCSLLGQLYVSSLEWDESGSINICVINSLDKWTLFNKKRNHPQPKGLLILYSQCLLSLLSVAGFALEAFLPTEMLNLFSELHGKVLAEDMCRDVRKMLLELLILRAQGWQKKSANDKISRKLENHLGHQEKVKIDTVETGVNTEAAVLFNSTTQTDKMFVRSDSRDVDSQTDNWITDTEDDLVDYDDDLESESGSLDWDSYSRVEEMLRDLRLTSLDTMFKENGIRDSVLDVEPEELKELLKECGFKPGQILEIRKYLSKPRKKEKVSVSRKAKKKSEQSNAEARPVVSLDYQAVKARLSSDRPPSAERLHEKLITPADFNIPSSRKPECANDTKATINYTHLPASVSPVEVKNKDNASRLGHQFPLSEIPLNVVTKDGSPNLIPHSHKSLSPDDVMVKDSLQRGIHSVLKETYLEASNDVKETGLAVKNAEVLENGKKTEHRVKETPQKFVEKSVPSGADNANGTTATSADDLQIEDDNSPVKVPYSKEKSPAREGMHPMQKYSAQGIKKTVTQWLKTPEFKPNKNQDSKPSQKNPTSQSKKDTKPQFTGSPKFVRMSRRPVIYHNKASEKLDNEADSDRSKTIEDTNTSNKNQLKQPSTQKIYMPPSPGPMIDPVHELATTMARDRTADSFSEESSDSEVDSDSANFSTFAKTDADNDASSSAERLVGNSFTNTKTEFQPFSGFTGTRKCTICKSEDHQSFNCPEKAKKFFY